jgi:hypothetical protein
MALQGCLSDLPFEDLLDLLKRRNSDGYLELNFSGNFQSHIILNRGNLYAAWVYRREAMSKKTVFEGEDAIEALLNCPDAEFSFNMFPDRYIMPERNIFSSDNELMLAHVFRGDEFREMPIVAAWSQSARPVAAPSAVQRPAFNNARPALATAGGVSHVKTQPNNFHSAASKTQHSWLGKLIGRLRSN